MYFIVTNNHFLLNYFQITVIGSMMKVERCDLELKNCEYVKEEATKGQDLIHSQQWNMIHGNLQEKKVRRCD